MNKTKSWFFEKINKIDILLARLNKKKRTQITKIKSEGDITKGPADIIRIIRYNTTNNAT